MIRRSRKARTDLVELAVYYGEKNPAAANRLLDRVEKAVELLSRHALLGRARPDLRQDLRSYSLRPLIIFYTSIKDGVELVRVLHSARNIGPEMFEED